MFSESSVEDNLEESQTSDKRSDQGPSGIIVILVALVPLSQTTISILFSFLFCED